MPGPPAPSWQPHSSLSCSNILKEKLLCPRCLLGTHSRTRQTNPAPPGQCLLLSWCTKGALGRWGFLRSFLQGQCCLARGTGTCLKLMFPLLIALFALGVSGFPPPSFPCTVSIGGYRGTHRVIQAPAAHPHMVKTDSASYRRWCEEGTSPTASSSQLCCPLPYRAGSKKGPSVWISAIRAEAKSSRRRARKPFLQRFRESHHHTPPEVRKTDIIMLIMRQEVQPSIKTTESEYL